MGKKQPHIKPANFVISLREIKFENSPLQPLSFYAMETFLCYPNSLMYLTAFKEAKLLISDLFRENRLQSHGNNL